MPQVFNGLYYHLIILLAYEDNKREIHTAAEGHRKIQMLSCASTFICRGHSWEEVKPRLGKEDWAHFQWEVIGFTSLLIINHSRHLEISSCGAEAPWHSLSTPVHTLPTGIRNILSRENQDTYIVLAFISRHKILLHG